MINVLPLYTAIDPGSSESAFVALNFDGSINSFGKIPNKELLDKVWKLADEPTVASRKVIIEGIQSYGMGVGKEVFDTCYYIGRLMEALDAGQIYNKMIYRKDVKLHHCHTVKASDSNIRYAIMDKFGGEKVAVGNKKSPGPLYNIKGDMWSALAIALYAKDTNL